MSIFTTPVHDVDRPSGSTPIAPAPSAAPSSTALPPPLPLGFRLDRTHEAHEPPEARGTARDGVRLLVSRGEDRPAQDVFAALPRYLMPGDLVVVNTSATVAAAIDGTLGDGDGVVVHVSTELPGGLWLVELRRRIANGSTEPCPAAIGPARIAFADGSAFELLRRSPGSSRLWLAVFEGDDVHRTLRRLGRPIRYRYVGRDWPLRAYQSVFGVEPGSAEMPSAARPFTPEVVTALVRRGIAVAPVTLHTGVSSLEGHELPYPERFRVTGATAALVNATHDAGGHVIAVGTTVVRALESATDARGTVHPAEGWTDAVITPSRGVRAVDGLVTGWHEPEATHLAMLEAVAGRSALVLAYEMAFDAGYLWHEFGDSHLLLPYAGSS